jgi:hypothetical protein
METPPQRGGQRARPTLSPTVRVLIDLAVNLAIVWGPDVLARWNRPVPFQTEVMPLESVLIACSGHSHIQVVIARDADGTTDASAPYGTVRDRAALDKLFKQCGLRYAVMGHSIIVMRVDPPQTASGHVHRAPGDTHCMVARRLLARVCIQSFPMSGTGYRGAVDWTTDTQRARAPRRGGVPRLASQEGRVLHGLGPNNRSQRRRSMGAQGSHPALLSSVLSDSTEVRQASKTSTCSPVGCSLVTLGMTVTRPFVKSDFSAFLGMACDRGQGGEEDEVRDWARGRYRVLVYSDP